MQATLLDFWYKTQDWTLDEYSDALKRLPPGLTEEIDGVTYETVQMSGAVFGEYVVIRPVEK